MKKEQKEFETESFEKEELKNETFSKEELKQPTKWSSLQPLDLKDPKLVQIPWKKYSTEVTDKKQIVLHDTISGPKINGDLATWERYKADVAAHVIIERDGTINQLFSSKNYAYHLGCGNTELDKHSIAIELDNWGQLEEKDGNYYTIYGNRVNVDAVTFSKGFRGEQVFEAYTKEQLQSLGELLLYWNKTYNIPLDYNEDIWDICDRALEGEPGVYAHVSYRPYPSNRNKWDAHPDPSLIELLKNLSELV